MKIKLYPCFEYLNEFQNVWLISDTHYGDHEHNVYRDFSTEERIKILNKHVGKKDCVICLGDVGNLEPVKKWKGAWKVLIKGNHDVGTTECKQYFDEVYEGPVFLNKKIVLSHEPVDLPFALNIHGHDHAGTSLGANLCGNIMKFQPARLADYVSSGLLSHIPSIHRIVIDKAKEK